MTTSARLLMAVLFAGLAIGPLACAGSAPTAGGTVTRALASDPGSLDPQGAAGSGLNVIVPYLFDTLVAQQRDGSYAGHLATEWRASDSGKTVDFTLRSGVKFHDGSPLDAQAVVHTFERFRTAGTKSPIAGNVGEIASVTAIDSRTVKFTMIRPTATLLSTLSSPYAAILSPTSSADAARKPVGTGPFRFVEWQQGTSLTLEANPDYRWPAPEVQNPGPVRFGRLVFRFIPEPNTQISALKTGEVDVLFTNDPAHLARLETDADVQVQRSNLAGVVWLGFNCTRAPLDDMRVRRALGHAVDRDEILRIALGGVGIVADTPLPPGVLGYDPSVASAGPKRDAERARALLREAGFVEAGGGWQRNAKPLALRLLTTNRSPNEAVATVIQSQLKAIGIAAEIQQLDATAATRAASTGDFDLLLWRYDWNDPDILNSYLSGSRIGQTNRLSYSNRALDAALLAAGQELDQARRATSYADIQRTILSELPLLPLYVPVEGLAVRRSVQGAKVGAMARLLLNDVTLSPR